jgi:hypothetical protein
MELQREAGSGTSDGQEKIAVQYNDVVVKAAVVREGVQKGENHSS